MGTLLTILAVLFIALIVIIPLLEKYAARGGEPKNYGHLTRWFIPLMMLILVLQFLRHVFG
ncbi:hypothetical protein LPB19_16795 [Marinobacter salinisoli]|uniref:Uncharacterized protein n=1 Tax=Marinobacter salinisoli TaxID=2769486 RepID=A0ABX7MTN9_9GAMM|nr:hypothetical protein [Marinobacter salinisoli]QSP94805.1 hypothetical protein LPB19_16795 [Marinobacter salinisoli]